jgi:hypothetical protein
LQVFEWDEEIEVLLRANPEKLPTGKDHDTINGA